MKKVQVRDLQKILQEHINLHKNIRTQNVNKAIELGDLQKPNFKKFIHLTDERISKAENILSSIAGEFNLVDEPEEEEEV
tara:strand:+ start:60 stop:299 length:240 start_codon:yes stop_codon:yes gene_type:complete